MSEHWLRLIPRDPAHRPPGEIAEQAKSLLKDFVRKADSINARFNPFIEFVHPGANWAGVKCSACKADAGQWWKVALGMAFKNRFAELKVTAPCCGTRISLNDLNYIAPAGFASFVLEAQNPDKDISPTQERALAACLGCEIRKIWVQT